jgi:chromosomal replication initiator protein
MKDKFKSISPYVYPGVRLTGEEKQGLMKNPNRYKMTMEQILDIISEVCSTTSTDIVGKIRTREVIDARFIFCHVMKRYYNYTLSGIGKVMSERDHTTIRHALIKFKDRYEVEEIYREKVQKIYEKIGISQ